MGLICSKPDTNNLYVQFTSNAYKSRYIKVEEGDIFSFKEGHIIRDSTVNNLYEIIDIDQFYCT